MLQNVTENIPILIDIPSIGFRAQTFQRPPILFGSTSYPYAQIGFGLNDWALFLQAERGEISLSSLLPVGSKTAVSIRESILANDGLLGVEIILTSFLAAAVGTISVLTGSELLNIERRIIQESALIGGQAILTIESFNDTMTPWTSLAIS